MITGDWIFSCDKTQCGFLVVLTGNFRSVVGVTIAHHCVISYIEGNGRHHKPVAKCHNHVLTRHMKLCMDGLLEFCSCMYVTISIIIVANISYNKGNSSHMDWFRQAGSVASFRDINYHVLIFREAKSQNVFKINIFCAYKIIFIQNRKYKRFGRLQMPFITQ